MNYSASPPSHTQQALGSSACIAYINYPLITACVYMTFPHFYRLTKVTAALRPSAAGVGIK